MRWFARIVGAALMLAGMVITVPEAMFLVYLRSDPLRFLGEFRRDSWLIALIGLILIVAGLCLALPGFVRVVRRSR